MHQRNRSKSRIDISLSNDTTQRGVPDGDYKTLGVRRREKVVVSAEETNASVVQTIQIAR